MARGGARKGAGKKLGQRDRATLEGELAVALAQLADLTEKREQERAASGRKQAVAVLDDIMHAGYGLMAKHQPLEQGEVVAPGSGRDPKGAILGLPPHVKAHVLHLVRRSRRLEPRPPL